MQEVEHVHFIGIGGIGMSGIARVLLDMGVKVSGSDLIQKELTEELASRGATIYYGHQSENLTGAELIVYSSDIPQDNIELLAAKEQKIPMIHRSDLLAKLLNEKMGVAVAGSHGKTTTTSMIAFIMERTGIEPTYVVGGEVVNLGSNARFGKGDYVIAEADESDKTFLKYRPYIGIVTNVSPDHLENYEGDYNKLKSAYQQFMQQIKPGGKAIICGDDAELLKLQSALTCSTISYGIDNESVDYRAVEIETGDRKATFIVEHHGSRLGQVTLTIPGRHNIYNALASIIVALEAGIPFASIVEELAHFQGAKRRFQIISDANDILIVDDYAVHPTEIKATLNAAKATGRKVYAVFQPHRISRAFYLLDQFAESFAEADEVLITDIYSPKGEKKVEGVDSEVLATKIHQHSNDNIHYIKDHGEITAYLEKCVHPGDLVITLGAGDIWKVARQLSYNIETTMH